MEQAPSARRAAMQPARDILSEQETEGFNMGIVMINCPETGSAIPTGIKADRERFRRSAVFFARTFCSICKTNHEGFAGEAGLHEPNQIAEIASAPAALHPIRSKRDLDRDFRAT